MELYKTLEELSDKVSKLRNHVATEEATKTAFVLPFLVSLGYDIYNPADPFYNDKRTPYSEDGVDVVIKDRKDDYFKIKSLEI